jgi:hypothetical protein
MKTVVEPSREIPVVSEVDVLVVGGGPAGCAAAIVAARHGAKTLLIEPQAFLGGMATQALFATWAWDRGLGAIPYGGIPHELVDRLMQEKSGILPKVRVRGHNFEPTSYHDITYNVEMLKLVLGDFMEEVGAEVLYHTPGVLPIMENGNIRGVIVENKSGRQAVMAKVVVDASGDGDIAARAGAPFEEYPDEALNAPVDTSPFTSVHEGPKMITPFDIHFQVHNVDWERVDKNKVRESWSKSHDPERHVQLHAGWGSGSGAPWNDRMTMFWLIVRGKRATDAMDLAFGERALKQSILEFWRFLRDTPGFENAHIVKLAHKTEVRGTRRIMGDYALTKEDVIQGSKFPDSIASTPRRPQHGRGGGDVSIAGKPRMSQGSAKGMHGYPYRCLLPKNVEGLLTAGRCISTEFEAVLGHPAIPACMLIGQAAGAAAALAVEKGVVPRQVDVGVVQTRLTEMGAELDGGIGDGGSL